MQIKCRKDSIISSYYNPWKMPANMFESWHLSSCKDYGRNEHSVDIPLPQVKSLMNIENLRSRKNYILYSGGKESFVTRKLLDYYRVNYELVFIDERSEIRRLEKHDNYNVVAKTIKDECHHIIESNVLDEVITSDRFGRNFTITYWYILECLERFGNANILVGSEWLSPKFLHNQMKYEHSDLLYSDINADPDISGCAYSVVNSLLEFDVFRLAVNHLGYDIRWSYYDHKKKEERIRFFMRMNNLINDIGKSSLCEDVLSELEFIVPQYRIMEPIYYDFRYDVSNFIESITK